MLHAPPCSWHMGRILNAQAPMGTSRCSSPSTTVMGWLFGYLRLTSPAVTVALRLSPVLSFLQQNH